MIIRIAQSIYGTVFLNIDSFTVIEIRGRNVSFFAGEKEFVYSKLALGSENVKRIERYLNEKADSYD